MFKKIVSTVLLFIGISFAADTTWCMNFGDKQLGYVNWHDSVQVCPFPNPCRYEYYPHSKPLIKNNDATIISGQTLTNSLWCNAFAIDFTSSQIWINKDGYIITNFLLEIVDSLPENFDNWEKFSGLQSSSIIPSHKNVRINRFSNTSYTFDLRGRAIKNITHNHKIVLTR
jgi:hypothetical protein